MQHDSDIRELLARVRGRWRALHVFQATVRAALAAAGAVGVGLFAMSLSAGVPTVFAALAVTSALLALAGLAWGLLPLRAVPSDAQVARFIEERVPALDDRLVTAVDAVRASRSASPAPTVLIEPMLADAARRSREIDLDAVLPVEVLRRAGFQAAAAALVLGALLWLAGNPARQAFDAVALTLFPQRVALDVTPGNAKIKIGTALAIRARLVGNRAPVIAQVQIADGGSWRIAEMTADTAGTFRLSMPSVSASFTYRIVVGPVTSPTYRIAVAQPPRVTRIDLDYTYPAALRLPPRTDPDSGDIYAPAGTDVRVHVFTDRPVADGQLALANGGHIGLLAATTPNELSAALKIVDDNSYRVVLADRDGFSNPGDIEYFIRTLADRPPDVRILNPATDRQVTRLEEVDIEAQADDDYGIESLDLVYSVSGSAEKVVPLDIPRRRTVVEGRHTLYLEDLDVHPGDFISYYVRARDLTRGTPPNEARSDIFFLEMKPYEQEFVLAQSQGAAAGVGRGPIDDLVAAQKEVVVATWKLDRRAQSAKGAKSEQDIRLVSRAEAELKTRVEKTASGFRESTMRDPRRRQPQRGRGAPPPTPELKAGQTLPEEDDMTAAATAMGKAVASLDGLKTADALPPEMEALNRLLKAQADVKRREVQRANSGSGSGTNRSNYDLSTLFDRELQKAQQTNYENRSTAALRDDANQSALDTIKDLARRQDELLKRQQALAKEREKMTAEELTRELETLTREQSELRQRAEELSRQMASKQSTGQQPSQQKDGQAGQQAGQSGQSGKQGQFGQQGQSGQGQQGQSGQGGAGSGASGRMKDVSEEMRNATSDLRRQDPGRASARGNRALDKLRELQRQLESSSPDEQRRALGELQLEARQLADAQRQISSELGKTDQAGTDAVRRLAGEEDRLANRTRRLQESLKQQMTAPRTPDPRGRGRGTDLDSANAQAQAAAGAAVKDMERQRVAERMQQSADAMRAAAGEQGAGRGAAEAGRGVGQRGPSPEQATARATVDPDLARAFDKIADTLASGTGTRDGESRKLSEQLAKTRELRDKLASVTRELDKLGRQAAPAGQPGSTGRSGGATDSARKSPGESGKAGEGQQGGGGADVNRLRQEFQRELKHTQDLVDELRREDPTSTTFARGGSGFTFEGQGMILGAPGTEAFKQDFAKWDDLRRQATQALESVESSLSKRLQAKESRDRLAAGVDDKAPPAYQKQVDSYFKAIAGKKKP